MIEIWCESLGTYASELVLNNTNESRTLKQFGLHDMHMLDMLSVDDLDRAINVTRIIAFVACFITVAWLIYVLYL